MRDLVKRYGSHTAVDHLSFKVEKGQIYGFLGPNGAGKTTTMNIMTGYIGPTAGDVIINGHNILDEPEAVKRAVGYLPEQPPLYTDMTPLEYLDFAAELKGLDKESRQAAVDDVIGMTKIVAVKDRLIKNLSKGYKQRVGLAQAILGLPEIIILDEPTVGLDPKQILEIRELIRGLSKDHTILLSSHILSEVQEICDHVLIIHEGHLVASGTPAELEKQLTSHTVEMTVKGDDVDSIRKLFSDIPDVAKVRCRLFAPGEVHVTVEAQGLADVRASLFYACAAAMKPILMMRQSGVSLEDIFLKLTSEKPEAGDIRSSRKVGDAS
ncbi:ABC transporter ATP-binding protein [Oscillospiraceae bacterium WX1]